MIFTFNINNGCGPPESVGSLALAACLAIASCADDGSSAAPRPPSTYSFERAGESTVAYTGQTTRQVVTSDVIALMRTISDDVLAGRNLDRYETASRIFARFNALYEEGGAADPGRAVPTLVEGADATQQRSYADLNGAGLKDKLAGNDAITDHVDWNGGAFAGWESANLVANEKGELGAPSTPEELALALFWTFAHQVAAGATGSFPIDAATPLYLTPQGHDLTQLVQKFLLGAVNFSQGTDDYLDDDVEDKGLRAANVLDEEGAYTTLEHHWDEGYGYWGAARDYGDYTDQEIAGAGGRPEYENGYHDSNGDGAIDLTSEYNFGASVNAAKRDRGSAENVRTDFTAEADRAWRSGRALIAAAHDAGEDVDVAALNEQRDIVVAIWEKAIAATAVHYINEVLVDMDAIGTVEYSFADHAKHWSELKGFALSFQFNPRSPMSDSAFEAMHAAIGDAPVGASPTDPTDNTAYRAQLAEARTLIGEAYEFDEANLAAW